MWPTTDTVGIMASKALILKQVAKVALEKKYPKLTPVKGAGAPFIETHEKRKNKSTCDVCPLVLTVSKHDGAPR